MDLPQTLSRAPFTIQQAKLAGVTGHALRRLVLEARVRRVLTGVYAHSDLPDTLELRSTAASLVVPQHAVMCDRTAAWVLGVDVLAFWELDLVPPIETVVHPELTRVRRAEALGGRRDLLPEDILEVHGVRVTSPLRTAMDLGCKLRRRDAVAAVDGLMREYQLTRRDLEADLFRFRGRRGVIQLRGVVAVADPRAESPGESWLRVCIVDAGLPPPDVQVWVTDSDSLVYRLDLGYLRLRIGVEFDGVEFHSSDEQHRHDAERRAWMRERGWAIIVVRKGDFTPDRINEWTSELRTLMEERRRVRGNPGVRRWTRDVAGVGRQRPHAP